MDGLRPSGTGGPLACRRSSSLPQGPDSRRRGEGRKGWEGTGRRTLPASVGHIASGNYSAASCGDVSAAPAARVVSISEHHGEDLIIRPSIHATVLPSTRLHQWGQGAGPQARRSRRAGAPVPRRGRAHVRAAPTAPGAEPGAGASAGKRARPPPPPGPRVRSSGSVSAEGMRISGAVGPTA